MAAHVAVFAASDSPIVRPAENSREPPRLFEALRAVACGVLGAWTLVLADAKIRAGLPDSVVVDHALGALGLYAAVGALVGSVVWGLIALERAIFGRRTGRLRVVLFAAYYFLVAAAASVSTAIWTFSGDRAQRSVLAIAGPIAFCVACGAAAALGAYFARRALVALEGGRRRPFVGVVAFLVVAGAAATYVDLTWYVALYPRLHTLIEVVAVLCFGVAYGLLLTVASRFAMADRVVGALGLGAAAWLALTVVSPGVRTFYDDSLKHVWLEEGYVGRMLRRLQVIEAYLEDPWNWPGLHMSRIQRLRKRYPLPDLSPSPVWSEPLAEPPETWDALRQMRGGQPRYDIIVFYVDSLRDDVAESRVMMPEVRRFAAKSLDFRNAYSTGSDTLRSLPALTGGNYDVFQTPPNDMLRVARRSGYETTLIIAKSAYEFLGKLRPEFGFERAEVIEDYPAEQRVWGYGAQGPTARPIVDRAIEELRKERTRPRLFWLFHFDQHNWPHLEADHIAAEAARFGLEDDPNQLAYRYRVVARSVDAEFGRLVRALEEQNRLENTIVLFVSDHGESLGRDGFWMHSVFLWEPLIRVPLVLHVPGQTGRVIRDKVSIVDVAPTLGRFMDPTLDGAGFHGQDLLGYLLPKPPPRRFPLLLLGASRDVLVRVGFVDPVDEFKLVLSLESALPELYDLRLADVDAVNIAGHHKKRVQRGLEMLVRSPVFPRTHEDFDVRDTREQKAGLTAAAR